MQAKLPKSLEEVGLKDIVDGESVYTVPWAMYADDKGLMWLNGNYTFENHSMGTLKMKVSKKSGGYICDVSMCKDQRWSRGGGQFVGDFKPLPVAKLVGF
ncbi:MAG: hypothetical protein WCG31_03630 [Deltaproteobacteria bacterium]|jgi:hypothetical protein